MSDGLKPGKTGELQLDNFKEKEQYTEKDGLTERKRRVSVATAARLRIAILIVSWVSVILLGFLGIATFVVSVLDHSSSSFAFALTAILDCLSSAVVIWRFINPTSLYNAAKERAACIALAILFILSGISVVIRSALAISEGDAPTKADIIWIFAIVNTIVCFGLFIAKLYIAYKLESIAVVTDSMNSLIGFILALTTLIGDLVYTQDNGIWYIDAVMGLCCAVFFFVYATWLLVHELKSPNRSQSYETFD